MKCLPRLLDNLWSLPTHESHTSLVVEVCVNLVRDRALATSISGRGGYKTDASGSPLWH